MCGWGRHYHQTFIINVSYMYIYMILYEVDRIGEDGNLSIAFFFNL